jgi:two-component system response regulator PilR (NtrC family)
MMERIKALLVHHNSETLATLKGALERQGMSIIHAESQAQAKRMLGGLSPAPLVFTDTQLPDGTWADILALAEKAAQPVNVIVVARVVDTRFYVQAIEAGAFDFLAPPFNATDLAYVVRTAHDNVVGRRAVRTHNPHPAENGRLASVREAEAQATPN